MRLRRGQLVAVEFLDHVENGRVPLRFTAYGKLLAVDKRALTVGSWVFTDGEKHPHGFEGNETRFTIVRSAVMKVEQLRVIKDDPRKS